MNEKNANNANSAENATKRKRSWVSKVLTVSGAVALTAVGCVVIPPLLEKSSNKAYKALVKRDEIDFDNLGPEIVRKDENKTEE